jgi:hypothetical protein
VNKEKNFNRKLLLGLSWTLPVVLFSPPSAVPPLLRCSRMCDDALLAGSEISSSTEKKIQ